MKNLLAALLCAVAAQALAEDLPVVVELYTSQGCSSCPPADALLKGMTDMEGVIPLSLHVDYWDYIGWPDTFGQPAHTVRQQAYAHAAGDRMVYTPQMIFNGVERVVGGDAVAVMEQLRASARVATPVTLVVERHGDTLSIRATGEGRLPPLTVQLVRYEPSATVAIASGENAGQTIDYANVVTDWQVVGDWSGEGDLDLDVPAPGGEALVVILQEHGPGAIRAAKRLD